MTRRAIKEVLWGTKIKVKHRKSNRKAGAWGRAKWRQQNEKDFKSLETPPSYTGKAA